MQSYHPSFWLDVVGCAGAGLLVIVVAVAVAFGGRKPRR